MRRVFNFLASYGLSCVLFILLLLLTFLGTLEQVDKGIYAVQKEYFESVFVVHYLFNVIPLPLPGAYLLMALLFVNLVCGAIVRARKGWSHVGILVAHLGIILLLVGSLVKYELAEEGHLTLYESEQSSEYAGYNAWEVAIFDPTSQGSRTEYLIPQDDFLGLKKGRVVTFVRDELPFDLNVTDCMLNAMPKPASQSVPAGETVVDGFYLEERPFAKEAEQNVPGAYVTLSDKSSKSNQQGILWGMELAPLVVDFGGKRWAVELRQKRSSLPFTVALNKFVRELHPRTDKPKAFISEVTVTEDSMEQTAKISMNEPLRRSGYTLYQASWGPPDAQPGDKLYSTLAVSRNPVEDIPLYASLVISLGLFVHFAQKLLVYLRAENRKEA